MSGNRAWAASAIVLVMVALQWIGPILLRPVAEPVVLGVPTQLTAYFFYGVISLVALWAVFRLVWPSTDE